MSELERQQEADRQRPRRTVPEDSAGEEGRARIPYLKDIKIFGALALGQFALLLLYRLFYSQQWLSHYAGVSQEYVSFVPYFALDRGAIPPHIQGYIAIYYSLSLILFGIYVVSCFVRRKKPVNIFHYVLAMAGIIFFLMPWLRGRELRIIDMSELHLGHIFGHMIAVPGLLIVVFVACQAAFDAPGVLHPRGGIDNGPK